MFYTNSKFLDFYNSDICKIHGRTIAGEEGSLGTSWPNSGIEFKFKGDRFELLLSDFADGEYISTNVKVFADDMVQRFNIGGKNPAVCFDFKKDGVHKVKILKISESNTILYFKSLKISGKNPEFLAAPKDKKLKIEFLGDSITAGFGVVSEPTQPQYVSYEQDSTRAYAYMTAELLDADIRTVCMSGQGVYRNCGKVAGIQFKDMFNMETRGCGTYDHSKWTPDVMVLNCGTNDVPGETTLDEMYTEGGILLDRVRAAYPDAEIIWVYGMMNHKFDEPIKNLIKDRRKAGDKKMHCLIVKNATNARHETGVCAHPNVNASVRVSKVLAKKIKEILK